MFRNRNIIFLHYAKLSQKYNMLFNSFYRTEMSLKYTRHLELDLQNRIITFINQLRGLVLDVCIMWHSDKLK